MSDKRWKENACSIPPLNGVESKRATHMHPNGVMLLRKKRVLTEEVRRKWGAVWEHITNRLFLSLLPLLGNSYHYVKRVKSFVWEGHDFDCRGIKSSGYFSLFSCWCNIKWIKVLQMLELYAMMVMAMVQNTFLFHDFLSNFYLLHVLCVHYLSFLLLLQDPNLCVRDFQIERKRWSEELREEAIERRGRRREKIEMERRQTGRLVCCWKKRKLQMLPAKPHTKRDGDEEREGDERVTLEREKRRSREWKKEEKRKKSVAFRKSDHDFTFIPLFPQLWFAALYVILDLERRLTAL